MDLDRDEIVAKLGGPEMQGIDQVIVKTADGTTHAIVGITRVGAIETTVPSGVSDQPPQIIIQLA